MRLFSTKEIKLNDTSDFPTYLTLCEELGVILLGTNQGKIYQYLWPFISEHQSDHFHVTECSASPIKLLKFGIGFDKLFAISQNKTILQYEISQYVEGE